MLRIPYLQRFDLDLGGDYINPLSNDSWRINYTNAAKSLDGVSVASNTILGPNGEEHTKSELYTHLGSITENDINVINVYGSDGDDTFDLSGDTTQQFVVWSKGNDTVIGGLDIASNPNTFLVTESYALLRGNQGLTLNNSSGTMDITTSYGTSTYLT